MTEDEARAWITAHFHVSRETEAQFERFIALLSTAANEQNLIARSTFAHIWTRHIADSAQLLLFAGSALDGVWADLGSGAGFPGLVIALLDPRRSVVLIEERRLRIAYLTAMVDALGLSQRVTVIGAKVEQARLTPSPAVISARAFAPLSRLFALASPLSTEKTCWILPKGRMAQRELDEARKTWHGVFHVKPSVTDPEASIIVARDVRRKASK